MLAQTTPLLKKPGLNTTDPVSYKPISNLNFIGKVLERLHLARLLPHGATSFCPCLLAYRQLHSIETALLTINMEGIVRHIAYGSTAYELLLSSSFFRFFYQVLKLICGLWICNTSEFSELILDYWLVFFRFVFRQF